MAIDGCLTCPDSSLRFNGGNGATTCGKLNDLIVNIGTTKPEARPAKCPLPPLTGQEVSELIADRNEARSEVRALREQRDAIREKHRVEIATLTERLEKTELERDHARTANGWEEWKRATLEALDTMKKTRNAATERADLAEKKLAALVAAVPDGRTVLCVEVTDACTSCGELVPESPAEDKCPACGAEWCMTTYVGDPEYRVTHTELGNPPSLDEALRVARGELAVPNGDATTKLAALVEAAEGVLKYRESNQTFGAWGTLLDTLQAVRGGPAVPSGDATTKLAALVEAVASSMSSIQADCHPIIINRLSDALEAARGES